MQSVFKSELARLGRYFFLGFFVVGVISAVAVVYLHQQFRSQIARSYSLAAKASLVVRDNRQAVLALNHAFDDGFLAIVIRSANEPLPIALPSDDVASEVATRKLVFRIQNDVSVEQAAGEEQKVASIEFYYSIERALLLVLTVFVLIGAWFGLLFVWAKKQLGERHLLVIQQKEAAAAQAIASQVSHDIRSPLSALNMATASLHELPEEKRLLIRNATQRINDIANQLLKKGKASASAREAISSGKNEQAKPRGPVMLVALLDAVVSEKRLQYREQLEVEIQAELARGYGLFCVLNTIEFSRVISNLVNNSIESFDGKGRVTVAIHGDQERVVVEIKDNGKGIPREVLALLGKQRVTFGKEGTEAGSGLGVLHAHQTIAEFGGSVQVDSELGAGTTVTIALPRTQTPGWFVERLELIEGGTIVSVDDDQTIHQIWSGRLASAIAPRAKLTHLTFSTLENFKDWLASGQGQQALFLVDYEFLGSSQNGLDAIEALGIAERAILVTSRYEEPQVRRRAEDLGVRVLPKSLAPLVPFQVAKPRERFDAILIDDDDIMHMSWKMVAANQDKRILCFATAEEFYAQAAGFDLATPIYIDVSLGKGVRGETVATEVGRRGFSQIFLATGHEADAISKPACVQAVRGKEPPF